MATALHVRDVQLSDFQQSVIDESFKRPVAVDFWAPWCGPCRVLSPILERLADQFAGDFLLAKVNTEENPEIAEHFAIRSIPNVKLFKGGTVVDEFMGAVSESRARSFLRKHCPTAADRRYAEGLALLQRKLPAEAQSEFESALELDPAHGGTLLELENCARPHPTWPDGGFRDGSRLRPRRGAQRAQTIARVTGNLRSERGLEGRSAAAEPTNLEPGAHACRPVVAGDFRAAGSFYLTRQEFSGPGGAQAC